MKCLDSGFGNQHSGVWTGQQWAMDVMTERFARGAESAAIARRRTRGDNDPPAIKPKRDTREAVPLI